MSILYLYKHFFVFISLVNNIYIVNTFVLFMETRTEFETESVPWRPITLIFIAFHV